MDIGEPIREIEVIPEHIPVPSRVDESDKSPAVAPTPKEKEPVKSALHLYLKRR